MAIEEKEVFTFELDEEGVMHLLKTTSIVKDGAVIAKNKHRSVLDPESKDYSTKLATVASSVVGDVAINQQKREVKRESLKAEIVQLKVKIKELEGK